MSDQHRMQHPGEQYPTPPLAEQEEIPYPGHTSEMVSEPTTGSTRIGAVAASTAGVPRDRRRFGHRAGRGRCVRARRR